MTAICALETADAETTLLRSEDLTRVGAFGWIVPKLELATPDQTALVISAEATGSAAGLLRQLHARGQAAGLMGVLYDNRDRQHSHMPNALFPQMTAVQYAPDLSRAGLDYGLAGAVLFPMPTLGNSSTAVIDGDAPRSLARLAMTTPLSPARVFRGYAANHLYVYPEHADHDAADMFPANWPYMVISQGSSGSDQSFLQALAMTLAAFRPDTRKRLEEENLIAPVLQMILRRTQTTVRSKGDYLSGAAHPTVFAAEHLSPGRMISLASSMLPSDIPPMIRVTVVSEDFGPDADLAGLSEQLFTTPSAIGRIWRGPEHVKHITVSAQSTQDPNGRDLQLHWVLLRGDPKKVRITPNEDGLQARIEIEWHDPFQITPRGARVTSRVDIGVIAWNGVQFSAPAVLSVSFPAHQSRFYGPGENGEIRLDVIDYDALSRGEDYDPMLHWSAPWQDAFDYDPDGALTGWRRTRSDGQTFAFPAEDSLRYDSPTNYQMTDSQGLQPVLQMQPSAGPQSQ